jgi:hypothetical protein
VLLFILVSGSCVCVPSSSLALSFRGLVALSAYRLGVFEGVAGGGDIAYGISCALVSLRSSEEGLSQGFVSRVHLKGLSPTPCPP